MDSDHSKPSGHDDGPIDDLVEGKPIDEDACRRSGDWNDAEIESLRLLERIRDHGNQTGSSPGLVKGYEVYEELGRGEYGVVHRALDRRLARIVALKTLRPQPGIGERDRERFLREARVLASLDHPHIVKVWSIDEDDGLRISLEFLSGRTLAQALESETQFGVDEVVRIGRQLCDALGAMHERDLVHGDLKPDNVMIEDDGRAVLLDFGIARSIDGTPPSMTATTAGAPMFTAPERLDRDQPIDRASDLYSLGVLLYWTLTGNVPYPGKTAEEVRAQIRNGSLVPICAHRPGIPPELAGVIEAACSPAPDDRPESADQMKRLLERVPHAVSIRRKRRAWIGWMLAGSIALALGWWTLRDEPPSPEEFLAEIAIDWTEPEGAEERRVAVLSNSADVFRVPEEFPTIQSAIEEAMQSSPDNPTITVGPGVYRECLDAVRRTITLVGREGAARTIVSGERGLQPVLHADHARLTIYGLTIARGQAGLPTQGKVPPDRYGAGIHADQGDITIYDSMIVACGQLHGEHRTTFGGGAYVNAERGRLEIHHTLIARNSAWASGGAILVGHGASATLEDCTVIDNHSTDQPAGYGVQGGLAAANEPQTPPRPSSRIIVRRSIVWGNDGDQIAPYGTPGVDVEADNVEFSVSDSVVEGGFLWTREPRGSVDSRWPPWLGRRESRALTRSPVTRRGGGHCRREPDPDGMNLPAGHRRRRRAGGSSTLSVLVVIESVGRPDTIIESPQPDRDPLAVDDSTTPATAQATCSRWSA